MIETKIVTWLRENYNLIVSANAVQPILDALAEANRTGVETEAEVRGRDVSTGIPQAILVLSEEIRAVVAGR